MLDYARFVRSMEKIKERESIETIICLKKEMTRLIGLHT